MILISLKLKPKFSDGSPEISNLFESKDKLAVVVVDGIKNVLIKNLNINNHNFHLPKNLESNNYEKKQVIFSNFPSNILNFNVSSEFSFCINKGDVVE